MTTFNIDDGSLAACETVEQMIHWLTTRASFVDHRTGVVSLDHMRDALRHAVELGRRATSAEVPDV
jgi:uncharacterized lipoprotein NlpE involved in copper resistance